MPESIAMPHRSMINPQANRKKTIVCPSLCFLTLKSTFIDFLNSKFLSDPWMKHESERLINCSIHHLVTPVVGAEVEAVAVAARVDAAAVAAAAQVVAAAVAEVEVAAGA